jgi:aspartate/methionine/tyrosine aminotransferase
MPIITDRIVAIQRSGIRAIVNLANEMAGDVIHLEIGQPHFPTPPWIVEAATHAAAGGYIRYTKNEGIPEVRAKIAARLIRDYPALQVTADNLLLTIGGVYGLAISMAAVVNPGEAVLIPDPGWPNYTIQAIAVNAVPRYYPLRLEHGFTPDLGDLERAVTADTRVLVVNNPSNPAGAVMTRDECRALLDFAAAHRLVVIADEVYDRIVYGVEFTPMATVASAANVITVNSFSKTYAMTGWRIGYVLAQEEICRQLVKFSEAFISCPPYLSQKAAEAAVTGPKDFTESMVAYYRTNRDLAVEVLSKAGLRFATPQGAFYMLVDITGSGLDSDTFARKLLAEARVAVAPGRTFGPRSDGFIRLSFCTRREELEQGLQRLVGFLGT